MIGALTPERPRLAFPTNWLSAYRVALAALTLVGLSLRIAGGNGGLWLDEAWSVLLAHEVGTPLGVLFGINHDNNHHLNSLWLLTVGMDAPPLAQRALAIATGTLAVPLAASLARKAGTVPALVTAALFAVSPILVTLGSEARGYAPMTLALLGAAVIADRAVAGEPGVSRRYLAVLAVLGLLSQLTMIFGLVALSGWVLLERWQRDGAAVALRLTTRLFAPAFAAVAITLALLAFAAWASPLGFQFGSYEKFTWMAWLRAVVELTGFAIGWPVLTAMLPIAALILLLSARRFGVARIWLYRLAIAGFPIGLAVIHSANPGHARYYLLTGIALLLLLGEVIGKALTQPGLPRLLAVAALTTIMIGSVYQDGVLATNLRADPAAAIRALAARSPAGATVMADRETGGAVLKVAAAQAAFPLTIADACASRFAFLDRFGGELMPGALHRCGALFLPVAAARVRGLSGTHWTLYERRR
jgi:hypothetical protein